MLDHEGRLGLCPTAARRQHLGEATPPGAGGQISHSGHSPSSGTVGVDAVEHAGGLADLDDVSVGIA